MAVSDDHARLTAQGVSWLKKNGFGVVTSELVCSLSREQPDVIGFRELCSAVIECKVSRADFKADAKKPERSTGGLGTYRFYLCPEGLIDPAELPPRWGLLYSRGRSVIDVIRPQGNLWPAFELPETARYPNCEWLRFQHQINAKAERSALYSIARRQAQEIRKAI